MSIEITAALAAVTAAAIHADFSFWSTDEDGDEMELLEVASAAQAVESLLDPQGGWVRVDDSSYGRRQANPEAGYVISNELETALRAAEAAGANTDQMVLAVEDGTQALNAVCA